MRFQNFPNFAKKFSQFLGYTVCVGENYGGEKKVSNKKKISRKYFWGNFFYFLKISLGIIFYFAVCTLINCTYTRSNSESVI